jgi:hypothetical protein
MKDLLVVAAILTRYVGASALLVGLLALLQPAAADGYQETDQTPRLAPACHTILGLDDPTHGGACAVGGKVTISDDRVARSAGSHQGEDNDLLATDNALVLGAIVAGAAAGVLALYAKRRRAG